MSVHSIRSFTTISIAEQCSSSARDNNSYSLYRTAARCSPNNPNNPIHQTLFATHYYIFVYLFDIHWLQFYYTYRMANVWQANTLTTPGPAPANSPNTYTNITNTSLLPVNTPSSTSSTILQQFLTHNSTQKAIHNAVGHFLSLRKEIKEQERSFQRTKAACADGRLPKSLSFDVVTRIQLPKVNSDDPLFFASHIAAIRKHQQTAIEGISKELLAIKEKTLTHLQQQAELPKFIQNENALFHTFVKDFAQRYSTKSGTPITEFPITSALDHFDKHLRSKCQELLLNDISTERKEKEVAQQESINSNAALEQVVKGAHTSETIRAVAREEVDNRFNSQLTSLQQAVEELQQQQKQKAIHLPPRSDIRTQQKQYHSRPITKQKRDKEQHNHHEGNNQHQHVKFNLQSGKAFQASNSNSSRLSTSALQNTSEPPERGPVSRSTMDTTVTAQTRKRSHSYANAQLSEQSSNSMKRSKNTSNQSEPKKEQGARTSRKYNRGTQRPQLVPTRSNRKNNRRRSKTTWMRFNIG